MRVLRRLVIFLLLLIVLALSALVTLLPTLAKSPEVKDGIQKAAHEATGRAFAYTDLTMGLFPPRLILVNPELAGDTPTAAPFLSASNVDLRLAILPLFARTVLVDSLVIEDASLNLRRTADGFVLPVREKRDAPTPKDPAPKDREESAEGTGVSFGLRSFALRNANLSVLDETFSPPAKLGLHEIEFLAAGTSSTGPINLSLKARLPQGGGIAAQGSSTLDGALDLVLDIEKMNLSALEPMLKRGRSVGGALSGSIRVQGPVAAPSPLVVELSSEDLALQWDEVQYNGPLDLRAELTGPLDRPMGSFEADATQGEINYGDAVFTKPSGKPAKVTGKIRTLEDGSFELDDVHLKIHTLDATARVQMEPLALVINAAPFSLQGWEALLPALAGSPLQGQLGLEELHVDLDPLALRGNIQLKDVLTTHPTTGSPIVLRGTFNAVGQDVRSQNLEVELGEQRFLVEAQLSQIFSESPHYDLGVTAQEVSLEKLLLAVMADEQAMATGPLSLLGHFSGNLSDGDSVLKGVTGQMRLDIGQGQLRGVSLLRSTVERFGELGNVALALGKQKGGSTLQKFYEDTFESVSGTFLLANGVAKTDDLNLRYEDYIVDLNGVFGLLDESINAKGKLTILPEVDEALAEAAGAEDVKGEARVIPLAEVRGTLSEPKVVLTQKTVVGLLTTYSSAGEKLSELEKDIDEVLGEGAGKAARGLLDSILGGGE